MSVTTSTLGSLADLEGKDVILALNDETDVEGHVVKANAAAIILKSGNKTELYERHQILDYEIVDKSKPRKIVVRWIAHPTDDKIRQHLADRHAIPVDLIPSTIDAAKALHDSIDHEKRKLGHRHGEKPKRRRRTQADLDTVAERASLINEVETEDHEEGDDNTDFVD